MTPGAARSIRGMPFAACLACMLAAADLHGQEISGLVAEQGSLEPVQGARVMLFRVGAAEDSLEEVTAVFTDEEGAFLLVAGAPGRYRIQAEANGLSSALSPEIELAATGGARDLVLIVPSPLLMKAMRCDLEGVEGGDSTAVVVGTVRERDSDFPLPGVLVTARWGEKAGGRELASESDSTGLYLLCGVGTGGTVRFRAEGFGYSGEWDEVELERPAIVVHDMTIALDGPEPSQAEVSLELAAIAKDGVRSELRGEVLDQATGEAVSQATVVLEAIARDSTVMETRTDAAGRFVLPVVPGGTHRLEIRHIAYGSQSIEIDVPDDRNVIARIRVPSVAILLSELEAQARMTSPLNETARRSPASARVLAGAQLRAAEARGWSVTDFVRTMPGVRLDANGLVYMNRGLHGLRNPVPAIFVVDGSRTASASVESLADVESIRVLTPLEAGIRYGLAAAGGVIEIYTRGRGPFRSPERDHE